MKIEQSKFEATEMLRKYGYDAIATGFRERDARIESQLACIGEIINKNRRIAKRDVKRENVWSAYELISSIAKGVE